MVGSSMVMVGSSVVQSRLEVELVEVVGNY